jgi:hypothetical protein
MKLEKFSTPSPEKKTGNCQGFHGAAGPYGPADHGKNFEPLFAAVQQTVDSQKPEPEFPAFPGLKAYGGSKKEK